MWQRSFPRKRAIRLKTEGAFHTYYMDKAAELFRAVLDEAEMRAPEIKVLSNYTGGFHDRIRPASRSVCITSSSTRSCGMTTS